MSINLHFDEKDWERIQRDWSAWWQGELDRPLTIIETFHPIMLGKEVLSKEFLFDQPADEALDLFQQNLESRYFYGDAMPKWWPNFGPGIAAGFLAANVHCRPEQGTVWFDVDRPKPLEDLHFEFDPENPWWRRVKELTQRAVERFEDKVSVCHTDLGGNLDILASFRTANQLLLDLYEAPDQVLRLGREITRVWLRYYDELYQIIKQAGRGTSNWAEVWSPGRCYMFQSDLSYMISPKMFEQFVMPDLAACFEKMDHTFYHLDGKGQIAHLDLLLSMKEVDGIQWIPGAGEPPPEEWLPLLKRIRDGGKLCQVYVTAEGARKIVKEIGGKGFALYVVPFPVMTAEQARGFVRTLAEEDLNRR